MKLKLKVKEPNWVDERLNNITNSYKTHKTKEQEILELNEAYAVAVKKLETKTNPSLDKLKLKGRITESEYQALTTGTREDILEAFNIDKLAVNDEYVRSIITKRGLADHEETVLVHCDQVEGV